jgi:hypothetical protein
MSSGSRKYTPPLSGQATAAEDRRAKVLRELKLALVDQQVQQEAGGFNPYDAQQGRGRTERWEKRRR